MKDGEIVGRGLDRARARYDLTPHGETEAVRDACRSLKTQDLSGCELHASCRPCVCAMEMARSATI